MSLLTKIILFIRISEVPQQAGRLSLLPINFRANGTCFKVRETIVRQETASAEPNYIISISSERKKKGEGGETFQLSQTENTVRRSAVGQGG